MVREQASPDMFMLGLQIDPFVAVDGFRPFAAGMTLGDALDHLGFEDCAEFVVFRRKKDGEIVGPDYKPRRAEAIVIEPDPGGSETGRRVFRRIAKVFAVTAAIFIGGAFLVGAIGGSALGIKAVAYIGFQYLADNLIDIYAESRNRGAGGADDPSTIDESFQLFGGGNALVRGAPVPVPLGLNRVSPRLATVPYPEIEGEESYINMTLLLGEKPVQVGDIRIGTTPLENFDDYELTLDTEGPDKFDKFPTVYDGPLQIQLDTTGAIRETLDNVDRIGVLLMYPNGLYRYDNGNERDLAAEFEIAIRLLNPDYDDSDPSAHPHGPWQVVVKNPTVARSNAAIPLFYNISEGDVVYDPQPQAPVREAYTVQIPEYEETQSGRRISGYRPETRYRWVTPPPIQVPRKIDLKKGKYEVRVKRLRADRALGDSGDRNFVERLDWVSLQSIRKSAPVAGDGYAMAHLRIKATNQVNGRVENINLLRGRKIPLYDEDTDTWGRQSGQISYGAWTGGDRIAGTPIADFDAITGVGTGFYLRTTLNRPSGTFEGVWSYIAESALKERQFACYGEKQNDLKTRTRERANSSAAWGAWSSWGSVDSEWIVADADKWEGSGGRPFRLSGDNAPTRFRREIFKTYWGIIENQTASQELRVGGWGNALWTRSREGTVTNIGISTNPAEIYRAILTEIIPDPLDLSMINDAEIVEWKKFCDLEDLTYSRDITTELPIEKVLTEVCYAGLAAPIYKNGKYSVIIDRAIPVVKALITPRNSASFRGHIATPDYPDALQCNFINRDEDFRADSRIVPDSGYTVATAQNIRVIDMPGITTAKAVWRVAKHIMKDLRLRPESFTVDVDFEHFVVDRGDRVWLSHDVAQVGQDWGRITAIDAQARVLTMDQPCTFVAGQDHTLIVRKNDNTMVTLEAGGSGTDYTVAVDSVAGLEVGNLWAFGIRNKVVKDCFIVSKEPLGNDFGARLVLQPYEPAVFTTEDDPGYNSVISRRVAQNYQAPPEPRILNILSDERSLPRDLAGRRLPAMKVLIASSSPGEWNASYTGVRAFRVRHKKISEPDTDWITQDYPSEIGGTTAAVITGVESRVRYDVEVQAIDSRGGESRWVPTRHTVIGNPEAPPDVTDFDLNVDKGQLTGAWTYDPPGDLSHFEILWSPLALAQVDDPTKMKAIIEEHPAAQRTVPLPALSGTFAIRAVNTSGNKSRNANFAEAPSVDPVPTLEAFVVNEAAGTVTTPTGTTQGTPFGGTKVAVEVPGAGGVLTLEKVEQQASMPAMSTWTSIGADNFLMAYAEKRFFKSSGTYTTGILDMGSVFNIACESDVAATSSERFDNEIKFWVPLRTAIPLSGGAADDYSIDVQVQTGTGANINSIKWAAAKPLISGVFRGRFVRFIVKVTTPDDSVSPAISRMRFIVSFTGREERLESIAGLATGWKLVNFRRPFYRAPIVGPGIQGATAGDFCEIRNLGTDSFEFRVVNGSGTQVARTVDFIVGGYGSRAA